MSTLAPESPLFGSLTIYQVSEVREKLADWLARSEERLEIDLAGIEEIDSAGLQLLALLKQESLRQGKTLTLRNHSPAVLRIFEKMNTAAFFGDPLLLTSGGTH